jgi:3-methyl-2-oxobutanoate hydroxymethyltransferase
MCLYVYEETTPVAMDWCIYHSEAVRRGTPNTFVIGYMPFLSYQVSIQDEVRNAGRFHKEGNIDTIKTEGGRLVCTQIKEIADGGMLVMGHIGLTPQSSGQLGGFKALGRIAKKAQELIEDAQAGRRVERQINY